MRFQITDREFHVAIFKAAGNPVFENFAVQAYAHAYAHRREFMNNHDGIRLAVADHEHILKALQAHDPDATATAMHGHIDMIASLLANAGATKRELS